jgi:hypothetical protein
MSRKSKKGFRLDGSPNPRWLPFVPRCHNRVRQRGSNRGSKKGPISVASGCFPLFDALMGIAKLFKLRDF